jgi:hypothetical protein
MAQCIRWSSSPSHRLDKWTLFSSSLSLHRSLSVLLFFVSLSLSLSISQPRHVISSGQDKKLTVYNLSTGKPVRNIKLEADNGITQCFRHSSYT